MAKDSRLEIRIDDATKGKAQGVAFSQGLTLSEFVNDLITEAIDDYRQCSICQAWVPEREIEGQMPWDYECRECIEREEEKELEEIRLQNRIEYLRKKSEERGESLSDFISRLERIDRVGAL